MALFLSEAVDNYERKQTSRGTTDLAEAALTLLSISEQSAALTEAVMTAEFTLMRQCQNLSEGETSNKMKDFGRKVWHNLKAFAKTVWAKIKEICRMVWRKLKEWGSQVLDMFSGKEMEIEKGDYKLLSDGPRILEKIINVTERGITTSDDAGSDLLDTAKELTKEFDDLKKAAEKEQKEDAREERKPILTAAAAHSFYNHKAYIKVGKNWLKSVQSTISGYATKIEKLAETMDKKVEEMEKLEGRMSHEDNQKDLNKSAAKLKEGIEILKVLATGITTLTTRLTKVGRAVTSGEKSDSGKELESIAKYVEANRNKFSNLDDALFDIHTRNIRNGTVLVNFINTVKGSSLEEKEKDKLIDRLEAYEELRKSREEEYSNRRS